jgi:hypothetical protein
MDRTTPVRIEFKYLADPSAQFAVEYAGEEVADTLPYDNGKYGGMGGVSKYKRVYLYK